MFERQNGRRVFGLLRGRVSAITVAFPVMILWLATTWSELDLLLVLLACTSALIWWRTQEISNTPITSTAIYGTLAGGLVCIGFDLLIPRLQFVEVQAATAVRIGGVLVLVLVGGVLRAKAFRAAATVTILFAILSGVVFIRAVDEPGIDVWRAHMAAAEVLFEGGNPYADLDVALGPSNDITLQRYYYPTVTLGWYSFWTEILGDPRWASLVAWLVLLCLGSLVSIRSASPAQGLSLIAFAAVQPGWFLLLAGSFTEPLVVMLVALSMAAFTRAPALAAVFMGLAVSSKQHLLVTLPFILLTVWPHNRRYAVVTSVTTMLGFLSGLIFGPSNYLRAVLVGPGLTAPFDWAAPNAGGVSAYALLDRLGLDLPTPAWIAGLAALIATLAFWKHLATAAWPAAGMAAVLAVFMTLIPFAIWSNWMIVTLLLTVVLVVRNPPIVGAMDSNSPPPAARNPGRQRAGKNSS